jgi:uncharacterized protein (TIGR01244 family)
MSRFVSVTPDFAVAAQLSAADIVEAGRAGFRTVVNNRPDGEAPGQMSSAEAAAAAAGAGLAYHALGFRGPPPPAVVAETACLLEADAGPVLAFCRTGTRSITAWGLAQALAGLRAPDEIIALAAKAGYDLSGVRAALEGLYPR